MVGPRFEQIVEEFQGRLADFVTAHLGMHVIDRTDRFTLIGSNARRGKLTLFDAEGPRERGALGHVALRVPDLETALAAIAHFDLDPPPRILISGSLYLAGEVLRANGTPPA